MDVMIVTLMDRIENLEDNLSNLCAEKGTTNTSTFINENDTLKARVTSLEQEYSRVLDENKSLLTALRLLNHSNLSKPTEKDENNPNKHVFATTNNFKSNQVKFKFA